MKKNLTLFLFPLFFLSLALPVLAQDDGGDNPADDEGGNSTKVTVKIENPFKFGDSLYDVLQQVVNNIILPIGGVLCVLAFIYAGFKFVLARGNETELKEAKRMLLYAAVGTALLLGAWTIAGVVKTTLNQLL